MWELRDEVKMFLVEDCMNDWNTNYCAIKCVNQTDSSELFKVPDTNNSVVYNNITCNETRSPAKEYFK